MAKRTFELLKTLEGYKASISGITQIRAGVIRPEIIIPHNFGSDQNHRENEGDLEIGKIVRIIRAPYFGFIGKVVELPTQPIDIETESKTRVLKVEFDGRILTIPRANVELIED
jgi:transcription antitermination factor NusG